MDSLFFDGMVGEMDEIECRINNKQLIIGNGISELETHFNRNQYS